ncbi:hypothetical protein PIB30_014926 [Stylosanthes scabra]|uniref:Ubiquitin-like protease family profile domain-containing protein n=1 Tax=Stylosanthes scabra TaxID=79078 RepID=A0ABU6V6E3_9FABA|nr:hypothetical protein [Stylosanthes scabra]
MNPAPPAAPKCRSGPNVRGVESILTEQQKWVVNYVFDRQADMSEELVGFGNCKITRQELMSLRPGNMPDDKIFEVFAKRLTLANERPEGPHFWTLPPSFADNVRMRTDSKQMIIDYKDNWMNPSKGLRYAYVPVKDPSGHWFLVVVGFRETLLFLLDASMTNAEGNQRHTFMTDVGDELSRMIASKDYPIQFTRTFGGVMFFKSGGVTGLPVGATR